MRRPLHEVPHVVSDDRGIIRGSREDAIKVDAPFRKPFYVRR